VLLQELREQVVVVPEEGPAVVLVEEAVAALGHFLVVRLALELAISRDKMTVRRAPGTEDISVSSEGPRVFSGAFFVGIHGLENYFGLGDYFALGLKAFSRCS
jgi:hypothetical protein